MPMHKSYGGEGKEAYKGNKSDSSLPQHGGEGKKLSTGGERGLLKTGNEKYSGPGVHLKSA